MCCRWCCRCSGCTTAGAAAAALWLVTLVLLKLLQEPVARHPKQHCGGGHAAGQPANPRFGVTISPYSRMHACRCCISTTTNSKRCLPPFSTCRICAYKTPTPDIHSPPTPNIRTAFLRQFTRCQVLTLSHNRLPSTCIPEVIDDAASPVQLQVVDMTCDA